METVTLNNGVKIPVFGLGTWALRGKQCENTICQAVEYGYRLIDTARMYDNEKAVGKGIKACGIPREELFITTKIYRPDNSYQGAVKSIERSLKDMQLDYIDLLLIHEPYHEDQTIYRAMKEAYQQGKIRAIGISNYNIGLYRKFIQACEIIPAINQVEGHVYHVQKELQQMMMQHGTVMQAWAPFTEGQRDIFAEPILRQIGTKYGKSAAQIALRYLLEQGIITVAKSAKPERLQENIDLFDFHLTQQELHQIHTLDDGKSLFGWY